MRAPRIAESAPQQIAAPQPATALHYFVLAVIIVGLIDFWLDIETGMGIPQLLLRHVGYLLSKGGRQ